MSELHVEPLGAEPAFEGYVRHRVRLRASDREHLLWWLAPADAHPVDASWLVAPSLHFGMLRGEDVRLHGRVSSLLMERIETLQENVLWRAPRWKRIDFAADEVAASDTLRPSGTMACLSLGVDTFYTVTRRRTDLDALFHFHGLESHHDDRLHLVRVLPALAETARALGLPLRLVESNVLDVWAEYEPTTATVSIPAASTAAQLLGSRYGTLVQSATHARAYNAGLAFPLAGYLAAFDTEAFQTELYGDVTRIEKLRHLKDDPVAMAHLRVCWYKRGVYNCGTCPKCVRTIVNLDLAGGAGRCRTLPATTNLERAARIPYETSDRKNYENYIEENLEEARRQGREDLVRPLEIWLAQNAPPPGPWSWPLRRLGSARRRWRRSLDKQTAKRALARHERRYPGRHLFETLGRVDG